MFFFVCSKQLMCLSLRVHVSVCPSPPLPTVHSINFKLGGVIAQDTRECSVECDHDLPTPNGTHPANSPTGHARTGTRERTGAQNWASLNDVALMQWSEELSQT